jgi:type IV pilus assembly protein PilB
LGKALISLGYIDEITMRDALCTQLHMNFFDLDKIVIDQKLASIISERLATQHLIVPLFCVREILVVAVDDPSQAALIEELETTLSLQIEIVTTTTEKLVAAIKRLYGPPLTPGADSVGRRNILVGPIRDFMVAELASRALPGVSVVPS